MKITIGHFNIHYTGVFHCCYHQEACSEQCNVAIGSMQRVCRRSEALKCKKDEKKSLKQYFIKKQTPIVYDTQCFTTHYILKWWGRGVSWLWRSEDVCLPSSASFSQRYSGENYPLQQLQVCPLIFPPSHKGLTDHGSPSWIPFTPGTTGRPRAF